MRHTTNQIPPIKPLRTQNGVALIVSLIILLILSILGVQSLQTSTLEEKMAGNFRDNKVALEAAESALLAGEIWIASLTVPPVEDDVGTNGVWTFGKADIKDPTFWASATPVITGLTGLNTQPSYVVEYRGITPSAASTTGKKLSPEGGGNTSSTPSSDLYNYRITARGLGGSRNSEVILQSHFKKAF